MNLLAVAQTIGYNYARFSFAAVWQSRIDAVVLILPVLLHTLLLTDCFGTGRADESLVSLFFKAGDVFLGLNAASVPVIDCAAPSCPFCAVTAQSRSAPQCARSPSTR